MEMLYRSTCKQTMFSASVISRRWSTRCSTRNWWSFDPAIGNDDEDIVRENAMDAIIER